MTAMNFPPVPTGAVMAFDCETTGLTQRRDRAFGFSVAFDDYAGYVDIRETPRSLLWLAGAVSSASRVVCHNAPFDAIMMDTAGLPLPLDKLDDTVTRACLINEHEREYSLDYLAKKYLKASKDDSMYEKLSGIFGGRATRNAQMRNIAAAPAAVVAPYATQDAVLTLRLWHWQEAEIRRQGIEQIVEFERSITPTLIRSTMAGIRVNVELARAGAEQLERDTAQWQSELDGLAGKSVNVNSNVQVKALFNPTMTAGGWVAANGTPLEKTDSGAPSINSTVLRAMGNDPVAKYILDIRSALKTKGVFLEKNVINAHIDGYVHPTFNQTKSEDGGTSTGRLSVTGVTVHQLPSRGGPAVQMVKSAFLPDLGQKWVSIDANSFEIRVFAHFIQNERIDKEYTKNERSDFHALVASFTGLPRSASYAGQANAKQISLSIIFGSGDGAIAAKMGLPFTWETFKTDEGEVVTYRKPGSECASVLARYHEEIPGVKDFAAKAKKVVTARGYLKTALGRRLRLDDPRWSYKYHGLLVQATAADISKIAWKVIEDILTPLGGRLIMSVHDSFEMSVPMEVDSVKLTAEIQARVRAEIPWFRTPLVFDLNGEGQSYWEAVK